MMIDTSTMEQGCGTTFVDSGHTKPPAIRATLELCEKGVSDLDESLRALEERLEPCLSPPSTKKGQDDKEIPSIRSVGVPLADDLASLGNKIAVVTARINVLRERLEL